MGTPTQKGFLRLSGGSLGTTTFVRSVDGYKVREKIVYQKSHFKNKASYTRVRHNAADFGSASSAASKIRMAVQSFLMYRKDGKTFQDLQSLLKKVVKLDALGEPGKQVIMGEFLDVLIGFDLNSSSSFKSTFNTRFSTSVDRTTGQVIISIPSFTPNVRIKSPRGTTHFKIIAAASTIDFRKKGEYKAEKFSSELVPLNDSATENWNITLSLKPGSTLPIFIYLGVEFKEVVLGVTSPVAQRKKDVLCIVNVVG